MKQLLSLCCILCRIPCSPHCQLSRMHCNIRYVQKNHNKQSYIGNNVDDIPWVLEIVRAVLLNALQFRQEIFPLLW